MTAAPITVTSDTLIPAALRYAPVPASAAHDLTTPWESVVAFALLLREERDACSWALGDLALAACEPAHGRPKPGQAERTVSALADAIAEDRSVLSALRANSEFYSPDFRAELPPTISWRWASECRRRSGWQVGTPIEPVHRARALKFALRREEDADDPPPAPPLTDRMEREITRLAALRFESATSALLVSDAIATLRRACAEETGETAEPEGESLPPAPPDVLLPVWSLEPDSTAWAWLGSLTDEQRQSCAIVLLEGAEWAAVERVRVRGMGVC